ncbi:uncharacterized protein LOC118459019 isoform X1 [Anopheles albimanus]|uniref:uncharacterized protein LOC118459019 isoform X1 n=1 Tax=Anopheles albimanus TaxID=7167 RepID=UPI001641CD0A|nr:uncharacterized protein LOC118459019 isoform X1 [Anopheles albimanus]
MMCSRAAGTATSTMMQRLARIVLLTLVLVALCRPAVEARANHDQRPSTVTVAEYEDSSFADATSDEEPLAADGSFEQDVSASNGRAVESSEREQEAATTTIGPSGESEEQPTGTTVGYNAVATTPKIVPVVKQLSRYEQGLEDYDEAADRAEREQQQQLQRQQQEQEQSLQQQYAGMVKPMLTLFNVISTVLSSGRSMRAMEAGTDGGNKNVNSTFGAKSTSEDGRNATTDGAHNENALAPVEGRYIKGDPLNGYYDFVISEGSYKFWAVFQVVTAAVVIYSTLTAIYYSKVAPLTSDYDYIDYLNGGRSFAGARPMIGSSSNSGSSGSSRGSSGSSRGSGRSGSSSGAGWSWDNLSSSTWFGPAAQAFTLVMDAIERQPK